MATQQQLRSKQLSAPVGGGMAQRLQAKQTQLRQKQQMAVAAKIQKAETQKNELGNTIKALTNQIKQLEVQERTGIGASANEASAIKYGKQAELAKIKGYYNKISQGGYYKNLSSLLESARSQGKQISSQEQAQFNVARRISQTQGPKIPQGATIISREGGLITYTLPGETRQPVTSEVKIIVGSSPQQQEVYGPQLPVYGPQLPPGFVEPVEKVPLVQRIFSKKVKEGSLGQVYVTPSEVSREDVGGRYVTVPEKTVSALTTEGTRQVATGTTTIPDIQSRVSSQQRYTIQEPKVQEVYNPRQELIKPQFMVLVLEQQFMKDLQQYKNKEIFKEHKWQEIDQKK